MRMGSALNNEFSRISSVSVHPSIIGICMSVIIRRKG